jgi:hypothetical protein
MIEIVMNDRDIGLQRAPSVIVGSRGVDLRLHTVESLRRAGRAGTVPVDNLILEVSQGQACIRGVS